MVFVILTLAIADIQGLIVLSELQGNVSFNTPNHLYWSNFQVQAPIKIITPSSCNLDEFEPLAGFIVINAAFAHRLCELGAWGDRGVVAIILIGSDYDVPAGFRYIWAFSNPPQIPFGEISNNDITRLRELLSIEPNATAIFASGDINEWREYARSGEHTALLVCVIILSMGAGIFSAIQLGHRMSLSGPALSLDRLSLGLVTVSSLDICAVMIFYLVRHLTDQIGYYEVFVLFLVLSDGLQLVACLAISYYWHHLMNDLRKTPDRKIPKKIAVPLFIFIAIIVVMLIGLVISIPIPAVDSIMKIVTPISYIVIAMIITIGWLIFGTKLYKYLRKSMQFSDGKKKFIGELSRNIIVASIMLFVTRLLEIAWTICVLIYSPRSILITLVLAALMLVATNVVISLFFKHRKQGQSSVSISKEKEKVTDELLIVE